MTVTNIINCTTVDNGSNNITIEGTTKILNLYNSLIVRGVNYTQDVTPRGMVFVADGHAAYMGDYNIFHSITEDSFVNEVKGDGIYYNSDMLTDWQVSWEQDFHSYFLKNIDSLFVNHQGQDFHLSAGSEPINKGSSAYGFSFEHDSVLRDATPDIGCYEYNPGSSAEENYS